MEQGAPTLVLFNGQGDYCGTHRWQDPIPPGCFVREVYADELELLKSRQAQMRADGTLRMRT